MNRGFWGDAPDPGQTRDDPKRPPGIRLPSNQMRLVCGGEGWGCDATVIYEVGGTHESRVLGGRSRPGADP